MGSNVIDQGIVAAEAQALRRLYEARFPKGSREMSQARFGDDYDIGSQGMVWQYMNGHRPLNLQAAVNFARGLGCSVSDFSPRLAESQRSIAAAADDSVVVPVDIAKVAAALMALPEPERQRLLPLIRAAIGPAVSDAEVEAKMQITRPRKAQ